jgi:hypothetical protein
VKIARRAFALILALGLACPIIVRAQNAGGDWSEYRSEPGGFAVLMPPGEVHVVQKPPGELGEVTELRFIRRNDTSYLVGLTLFKPDTLDPISVFMLFKADNLIDLGSGDIVRVERPFKVDDNMAVEVVVDKEDGRTLSLRAYAVGDRIIQTTVVGPKGNDASDDTKRFEDSFRLLTP